MGFGCVVSRWCAIQACLILFILLCISFGFFLNWVWFRTYLPSISIEKFGVPALNKTSYGTSNNIIDPTITFNLRLKNENLNDGIFYDDVKVNLYYYHANTSTYSPIGNISIPAFYQGFHKKAHRVESIPSYGVPWDIAKFEVLNGNTTTFRVDVHTRIRFKSLILPFTSTRRERYTIGVGGNIPDNDQGIKSVKKGLRLFADYAICIGACDFSFASLVM
ncbi:hypothetical protein MKW98_032534 [Papaver atlanticum]|uniref:Late embryogenesis abundant protein LEA-2 subgroup domain-containing protein n=1 Tax=Papaver atlanticum TaxID=357466 RepID=A0AAD4SUF0_9MAGN|nr:hypothetical protein MKW98_032534 [Papaver atlanticum]